MSKLKLSPLPLLDKKSNLNLLGDKDAKLSGYEVDETKVISNLNKLTVEHKHKQFLEKVKKHYKETGKEGKLFPSVMAFLENTDKRLFNWMLERIKETEPTLYKKEDLIQQILITNIIVNDMLDLMYYTNNKNTKETIIRILSLLSYDYLPSVWLIIFKDKIVGLLDSIKDEILNLHEGANNDKN